MAEFMSPIMTLVINVIYKRIKDLREDNDFTQQYTSDMLHISRSAYSAYENGANSPSVYLQDEYLKSCKNKDGIKIFIMGLSQKHCIISMGKRIPFPLFIKNPCIFHGRIV